jgi:hypothetical protein
MKTLKFVSSCFLFVEGKLRLQLKGDVDGPMVVVRKLFLRAFHLGCKNLKNNKNLISLSGINYT